MATTDTPFDGMTEHCPTCETDTIHDVSVQIRTESMKEENAQFSREPYRVAECTQCGDRQTRRMNNA